MNIPDIVGIKGFSHSYKCSVQAGWAIVSFKMQNQIQGIKKERTTNYLMQMCAQKCR